MSGNKVAETFTIGGLHRDDFDWACRQHEDSNYVLVRFELDFDGYHWKAVYVRAGALEKKETLGVPPTVSLSLRRSFEVPRP